MQKQPTMKSVAELAGVSIQTVSAIVNGKPGISPQTTTRVNAAIQSLGYRPYSVARSLRTRRTNTLALIVSDISNPSFSTIASAAEDVAHSFGYNLVFYNTHDDPRREAGYIQNVIERWMDGALFVSTGDHMTSLDALKEADIPTVAIDRIPEEYLGPSVTTNNLKAGRLAAEHLLGLGHTCIAHISGPMRLRLARERMEGFNLAVQEHGGQPGPCAYSEGSWECISGYEAMQRLLSGPKTPSAVFAANDRMAIGAMRAIVEAGLSVPQDISVVGVDDIEVAAYQTPALTTIRQSFTNMASLCVNLLIEILSDHRPEQVQLTIEPELVIRRSTAAPRNQDNFFKN